MCASVLLARCLVFILVRWRRLKNRFNYSSLAQVLWDINAVFVTVFRRKFDYSYRIARNTQKINLPIVSFSAVLGLRESDRCHLKMLARQKWSRRAFEWNNRFVAVISFETNAIRGFWNGTNCLLHSAAFFHTNIVINYFPRFSNDFFSWNFVNGCNLTPLLQMFSAFAWSWMDHSRNNAIEAWKWSDEFGNWERERCVNRSKNMQLLWIRRTKCNNTQADALLAPFGRDRLLYLQHWEW